MGVGTSSDVVAERSPRSAVAPRTVDEWSIALDCWAGASLFARLGCVLATLITLGAAALELIPVASGLALVVVMPAVLVDVEQHRLPDVWIGAASIVLLVAVGVGWSLGSTSTTAAGLAAGAVVMAAPLLILHLAVAGIDGLR